ncbi:hypothetical protein HHI36_000162 [Cryptolaemus montrouzieri]|uniref:Autophagy-related protein 2 n=1 Tax=Cryptolaemus montrouzieri TaxID=559131 RepID=A0ABD2P472_9CUCU
MPWLDWLVSERVKKNVCAYLIQRYVGQFFEEKLTSDQLSVDLFNGTGSVEKISLDVQALNELSEKQNWPLEFVDGFVEKMQISIPWITILKESSFVEIHGLKITVQPKQRNEYAASMFESMWNSMTSSLKLAEEYAKSEAKIVNDESPYEGLELFAKTIDSLLSRVQVKFVNTIIQVEHVPKDSMTGVGIVINIDLMEYSDEAGNDPYKAEASEQDDETAKKAYVVQTFTTKNFNIEGVTVSTVEFPSKARTFSRSMMSNLSQDNDDDGQHSFTTFVDNSDEEEDDKEEFVASQSSADAGSKLNEFEDQRHVVLFAKFSKKQVIKVHMKQSEDVSAPKVSIEVNLGHLVLFLSPRQVHMLIELAAGLASPDLEDHSNVPQKSRCVEKPMTAVDYRRVENELQLQMRTPQLQAAGLQALHGWSGTPIDESDTEEAFLPLRNSASEMYDSAMSGFSGSLDSSISSSAPSTIYTENTSRSRRKSRAQVIDNDPTAEISHFRIQVASLGLILLHEDLLNLNLDGNSFVLSSVVQMQKTAEKFFDSLKDFAFLDTAASDLDQASAFFSDRCKLNHIRLMAVPVHIEAKEKTTSSSFSISGSLHTSKFQILECLFESSNDKSEVIPLLKFEESPKPPISLSFRHIERTVRSSRKNNPPKTDINFNLGKCEVEFDITIIDRITALLNSPPVCVIEKKGTTQHPWFGEPPILEIQRVECVTDIKIATPCLGLKVRFPIPDFRPSHDLNRTPWWKRHVRPDHLLLRCYNATFNTSSHSSQTVSEYAFQFSDADVHYNETEKGAPIYIAKIGRDETYISSMQEVLKNPRVIVRFFSQSKQLELDEPDDIMTQSTFSPSFLMKPDNGPFTSKRVIHHSHDKQSHEEEELIIPGDKEEVEEFIRQATESTRMHIDISLSAVKMQLVSKHVYELIYNRINNDLLLWESNAPKAKPKSTNYYEAYPNVMPDTQDIFSACKSGVQYESESDSEDISEGEGAILFYSTYDRPKSAISQLPVTKEVLKQSNLVLSLQIAYGVLSCNTPVRDSTTNNVIPGHLGDFLLNVENATIFLVNGYKGDQDLGYISVQVGHAELHHCEMMPTPSVGSNFFNEKGGGAHLHPTLYKSEKGVLAEIKNDNSIRDMLTVACKIESKHETHNVKTIRVALGLNQATLRHRMCIEPNTWISQMLDFFNVTDYPIPGYVSKEVLTELHVHMWDCAIDYRPLYLPLRSVITLGCFRMTSHLSEKSNTSTLRFLAEDCAFLISDKAPPKKGVPSNAPVDIKRDYVNVISLGLFELSLRTTDKNSKTHPHIDMRATNDCVHIYTCSDSGRALTQLITYIATDGDLKLLENASNTDSAYSSPRHHPTDQELISVDQVQDISKLTKSQHQQVNELLGEALEEPEVEPRQENFSDEYNTGARLFFFPDENQVISCNTQCKPLPQVVKELGDITLQCDEEDSDDDFYFVDEETGLGLFPKNGVPEIKWLTNDPVRILENHFFVPVGKKDLLKTPDNFPVPKYQYTLCEMNIIWHMYGGNDFRIPSQKKKDKNVSFSDGKLHDPVTFSNREQIRFTQNYFGSKTKAQPKMSWKVRGGINRDHRVLMELELNKVRFQHEIYPETAYHASRQVLLISELEIRDVLANSEFNKFLYQYTSEAKPKQSQGHMIAIKAVHIRPDKNLAAEECCLRLSILPLRFNIDQDSLKFLVNFFSELGRGPDEECEMTASYSKQNTPTHQPPIMTINVEKEKKKEEEPEQVVEDNLIMLDPNHFDEKPKSPETTVVIDNSKQPVYFRNVVFGPDVPIKIDYQGKRVELADGSLASLLIGLVMGLGQLNCSELRLKRISYRHGLLGVDKLAAFLLQEWLSDIKKNQLPSLLSGVGPIYSLVQLFQGIKDLFWMPIEQYQKDGRIVRGIQRGANSFTTSTAMAALELTSRLIHLIQLTAETAYDMLSPGPSVRKLTRPKGKKKRYNQPQDIREGVANAYWLVKEGLGETAGTIVQVASHEHEQKGYSGAVGGVLRQIPPTILKPIIIASEATSNVLGGMKYQLIPDARNEANQKWRTKDE